MKKESRYRYEKRIKDLENKCRDLEMYRMVCSNLNDAICTQIHEGKQIGMAWIVRQFRELWK